MIVRKQKTTDCGSNSHSLRNHLEKTMSEMEKRHGALVNHRHYLIEKVLNMEKTMPILVAHKLWHSEQDDNFLHKKMQKLLDQLSPYPHPSSVDKLLKYGQDTLNHIAAEMQQLHDKIIETDVKLEETGMELESLLSVNDELDEKLKSIEIEVEATRNQGIRLFSNLHEIDSEDLDYLGKLRQLVDQEIRLKNCIKCLEDRESRLRAQLDPLLQRNNKSGRLQLKASKEQKGRNKKISEKSNRRSQIKRVHHLSTPIRDTCRCGREESGDQDSVSTEVDSKISDDDSSNEEYCECCDCESNS